MREYNFDGLVGPTHNYAGLSHGNVASLTHAGQAANPRAALVLFSKEEAETSHGKKAAAHAPAAVAAGPSVDNPR